MDPVLFLRQAADFQSMELERVEVIFGLEARSRARFRLTRGSRAVARKPSPFGLGTAEPRVGCPNPIKRSENHQTRRQKNLPVTIS